MNTFTSLLSLTALIILSACQSTTGKSDTATANTGDPDLKLIVYTLDHVPDAVTVCAQFWNVSAQSYYVPESGIRLNRAYTIDLYDQNGSRIDRVQSNLAHNTFPAYQPNANTHVKLGPGNTIGSCFSLFGNRRHHVKKIQASIHVLKLTEEDFMQVKTGAFDSKNRDWVLLRGEHNRP